MYMTRVTRQINCYIKKCLKSNNFVLTTLSHFNYVPFIQYKLKQEVLVNFTSEKKLQRWEQIRIWLSTSLKILLDMATIGNYELVWV